MSLPPCDVLQAAARSEKVRACAPMATKRDPDAATSSRHDASPHPSTTTPTFTPGFRTHMGRNWYLLGGVEVPATDPEPFDYQVLAGLMKGF